MRARIIARSIAVGVALYSFAVEFEVLRSPSSSPSGERAAPVAPVDPTFVITGRPATDALPRDKIPELRHTSPMRVFVDPETGEITSRPPRHRVLGAAEGEWVRDPLVETPSPYGGFMVDAGRRAWKSLRVARKEDGTPGARCGTEPHKGLP